MERYIVQQGDDIVSIAQKYGVSIVDLINTNNLENTYFLTPGTEIIIPISKTLLDTYTIKKGDTLYAIAKSYNIEPITLALINGISLSEYIYENQKLLVPKKGINTYITRPNDTLRTVSKDLGISINELLTYNDNIYLLPEQLILYKEKNNYN